MKNFKLSLISAGIVAAALVTTAPQVSAQTVYVNDAVVVGSPARAWPNLTLSQSVPSGKGWFGFDIETLTPGLSRNTYQFSNITIAEPTAVFNASMGDLIDTDFVSTGPNIAFYVGSAVLSEPSTFSLAMNETRYFAYWDDRSFFGGVNRFVVDASDSFGWVAITRTSSGLVASASATVTGGSIRVGSFTAAIPEPQSWALFALGLAGLSWLRRRA